ncbi:MAG TPA: transglutaminase-like domain-containing protein [Acidimicrobiales bacterium]|nr:transglutaminase-like domain-containing protein [Acidimicrobiales bacterium]
MSLVERIKRANRPGEPEHSITLRVAATGTVLVAIAACFGQGELSAPLALFAGGAVLAGNGFSYARRTHPLPWLKGILALSALAAFLWFFFSVERLGGAANLGAVERPLAVLFTWIQVTHSFDVPSRRDLSFSMAGSATLMAAAAAQAVDVTFGLAVIVWAVFGLVGLAAMWSSMAGRARIAARSLVFSGVFVLLVGLLFVLVLPAPRPSSAVTLTSSLAGDVPLGGVGTLEGNASGAEQPVHAAAPSGRTRIGGFLGFAGPLDTAIRGTLGNEVVLRVRADRPSFWIAETFDHWDGRTWTEQAPAHAATWQVLRTPPAFLLPTSAGALRAGAPDIQTFYLAQDGPNLIFHAAEASEVWFPAPRLFVNRDGNVRSGTSMGAGTVYTVESSIAAATAAELSADGSAASPFVSLAAPDRARFTQLPHAYPRVAALARQITQSVPTLYGKVAALERWIGAHTRYTTQIPPLSAGQDTVTEFLFGNRRGFCEQISTALAVMLRTLDVPAREATGYVPGPYNPITDLYDVQANDAHAWVQVWFPGYGWQSFDPTAEVPLANPTPAAALLHDALGALHRIPLVPLAATLAVLGALWAGRRRWRRVRLAFPARLCHELEEAARRARLPVRAHDTIMDVAARIDERAEAKVGASVAWLPSARDLAAMAEEAAYGLCVPDAATRRVLVADARRLARQARRLRVGGRRPLSPPGGPGPPRSSPRPRAGAGRT